MTLYAPYPLKFSALIKTDKKIKNVKISANKNPQNSFEGLFIFN